MSLRGALKRSWRRLEVDWRLKRSIVEGVVLLMLVQAMVAVYVLSAWGQQPAGGSTAPDVPSRVGQYVVLFNTNVAVEGLPPQGVRRRPSYGRPGRRATAKNTRTRKDEAMIKEYADEPGSVSERGQGADRWVQDLTSGDHRRSHQTISGTPPRKVGVPRKEELQTEVIERKNYKYKEEWPVEEEEEEDPILGRGYREEFVTYRSDGRAVLLVEDEEESSTGHPVDRYAANRHIDRVEETNDTGQRKSSRSGPGVSVVHRAADDANDRTRGALRVPETSDYKFKTYNTSHPSKFKLTYDTKTYFEDMGRGRRCFVSGTDRDRTEQSASDQCHCLRGYFGVDCGIPEAAWHGLYKSKFPDTKLRHRDVPRRLINGLTVNHEFAMFEARMHELYDVVDVFIVAESSYSTHGDPKDLHFLTRFRQGYLRAFQEKIVYVNMSFFSSLSRGDGWVADAYLRFYMGEKGLPLLEGLREDDLFVLSDSDELPTREILTFLKVYDGYPEPISFALRWNMFGFFWLEPVEDTLMNWLKGGGEQLTVVTSATTVGMLRKVYMNNVFYIRKKNLWQYYKLAKELRKYRAEGHLVKEWVAGTVGHYAGWHCSWCFSPVNMVRKMDSAQANDKPRWGDFPEKKNLSYIASRIWQGIWFDDKKHFLPVRDTEDRYYAPRYLLDHPHLYRSILFHPGHPLNLNKSWTPP